MVGQIKFYLDLLPNLYLFIANNFEGPEHLQAGLSDGD